MRMLSGIGKKTDERQIIADDAANRMIKFFDMDKPFSQLVKSSYFLFCKGEFTEEYISFP